MRLKQISSRDFQKSYAQLDEPHEVTSWNEPIGVWVPRDSALYALLPLDAIDVTDKPHPTQVHKTLPTGQNVVRQEVRIIDAVTISRQQGASREAWRQKPPLPRR